MSGNLVPRHPDATPAVYGAATLAFLVAMEEAAGRRPNLGSITKRKRETPGKPYQTHPPTRRLDT